MIPLKESKPIIKFEIGSKQPFALFFISAVITSSFFIIAALVLSGVSFTALNSLPLGDINNDGKINTSDAIEIILYEKQLKEFNGSQLDAADINSDNKIDHADALLIIQYSSGESKKIGDSIPTTLPPKQEEQPTSSYENVEPTSPPAQEVTFKRSGSSENGAFLTSEKDLYYTVRIINSWQSPSGKYMYQIQLKVKNNSFNSMYSTSADIVLSGNAQVEKSWDCTAKSDGNTVKVVTDDIGSIKHGKTYSCGFILSSDTALNINGIEKP